MLLLRHMQQPSYCTVPRLARSYVTAITQLVNQSASQMLFEASMLLPSPGSLGETMVQDSEARRGWSVAQEIVYIVDLRDL